MSRKILLIIGGSGYLGRHLSRKATETAAYASKFGVYATYHRNVDRVKVGRPVPLDVTNREAVLDRIRELRPHAIIHTAAINPGGGSEEQMMAVNARGSRHVAEAASGVGARLVHVSSDVVHDGQHAPYSDDVLPSPINGYARSKVEAEAAVAELKPQAAIVRTSLIYGLAEMDRGTAGFVERIEAGEVLTLFSDAIRQPVCVDSLGEALLRLAALDAADVASLTDASKFAGTLNVAGRQAMTREEFGRKMLAWWNVDLRGLVRSVRAADVCEPIPLDLRLTTDKAERVLHMVFPGVDEVLAMPR